MSFTASVDGVDQLAASCARAASDVLDLGSDAGQAAGDAVLPAVKPPIRTGALASTVRVVTTEQGFGIAAGGEKAPYVAIVHARFPFITNALRDREDAAVDAYADQLEQLVGTIQGT